MGKTVVILGAGASAECGAPVMRDFLDKAEDLAHGPHLDADDKAVFADVFAGIHRLQAVYAKSSLDLDNLEAVFVAFEMAKLLGRLGDSEENNDELSRLPDKLRRVIVRTLEETLTYPLNGVTPRPHDAYLGLARYLEDKKATVITFNYDCALEYAIHSIGCDPKYHLDGEPDSSCPRIDVLKLHGSLNWLVREQTDEDCRAGMDIRPIRDAGAFTQEALGHFMRRGRVKLPLTGLSPQYYEFSKREPIIVPPTLSKAEHHAKLVSVWRRAAVCLSEAEEIYVIGFSLPATDEFFRYLFALGTVGPARPRSFVVFDIYPSLELYERYRRLLGAMFVPRFKMMTATFGDATEWLMGTGVGRMSVKEYKPPS